MPRMLWRDCLTKKEFEAYGFSAKDIERQELMFELVHTEADYVRDLLLIQRVFIEPLRHLQVLSDAELEGLFVNIEEILPIHECIKRTLLQRQQEQYPILQGVSDILLPWVHELRVYSTYLCHQTQALRLMSELIQTNEKFAHFHKQRQKHAECRGLVLDAFLMLPFQRLLKYPLLLKNLLQVTPTDHPDHEMTQGVLFRFESLIAKIQAEKQQADRMDSLYCIQHSIKGLDGYPLVHPRRSLVRDGTVYRVKVQSNPQGRGDTSELRVSPHNLSPLHILLFNDLVLVLRSRGKRSSGLAVASLVKGDSQLTDAEGLSKPLSTPATPSPSKVEVGIHSLSTSLLSNFSASKTNRSKYTLTYPPATLVSVHGIEDDPSAGFRHGIQIYFTYLDTTEMLVFRCANAEDKEDWLRSLRQVAGQHLAHRGELIAHTAERSSLGTKVRPQSRAGSRWTLTEPTGSPSSVPVGALRTRESASPVVTARSRPLSVAGNLSLKWLEGGHNQRSESPTPHASPSSRPPLLSHNSSPPLPVDSSTPRVQRSRASSCASVIPAAPRHHLGATRIPSDTGPLTRASSSSVPSPSLQPIPLRHPKGLSMGNNHNGVLSTPKGEKAPSKAQNLLLSVKKLRFLPNSDAYAMRKFRKQLQDYGREDRSVPKECEHAGKKYSGNALRSQVSAPVILTSKGSHKLTTQDTGLLPLSNGQRHCPVDPIPGGTKGTLYPWPAASESGASPSPVEWNGDIKDSSSAVEHSPLPLDRKLTSSTIPLDPFSDEPSFITDDWLHSNDTEALAKLLRTAAASSSSTVVGGDELPERKDSLHYTSQSPTSASTGEVAPPLVETHGCSQDGQSLGRGKLVPGALCHSSSVSDQPLSMTPSSVTTISSAEVPRECCPETTSDLSLTGVNDVRTTHLQSKGTLVHATLLAGPTSSATSPSARSTPVCHRASYLTRPGGRPSKPLPVPPISSNTGLEPVSDTVPGRDRSSPSQTGAIPRLAFTGEEPIRSKPIFHPAQRVVRTMRDYYGNIVSVSPESH
ncbi:hypothetical protein IWQ62_003963 [Dispira parvispora]|uniref:DH domain-containing protein n=1 Tax=Dispira parvispora TaxID=1520584 RepID=A0A9W8AND4_9FUNG|nr:hypothetical protein IWQ62_003963 [Dispira parvispora]